VLLSKHDIVLVMPFPLSFSLNAEYVLLSKCDIGSLMLFSCSFLLDIILAIWQKMPMDANS
jgi:hypothetical protein